MRLPGRYDNATQVRLDARTGAAVPQPAIDLLIAPADAAFIGNVVFYVRETSSGDARRVLSQYIWVFGRTIELHNKAAHSGKSDPAAGDDPANAGRLEQHIYQFKEPQRWVHVGEQPEVLQSLLPEDLQRLTGCELLWVRSDKGFTAERHLRRLRAAGQVRRPAHRAKGGADRYAPVAAGTADHARRTGRCAGRIVRSLLPLRAPRLGELVRSLHGRRTRTADLQKSARWYGWQWRRCSCCPALA